MDARECLFEQLPSELNVLIIRMLDTHTLIRTYTTCKRWLNNAQWATDVDIIYTSKNGEPITNKGPINWSAVDRTFERFSPAKIRSFAMQFRPNDDCHTFPVVRRFINKMTRLESLTLSSSIICPYVTNERITELHVLGIIPWEEVFTGSVIGMPNLEKLSFQAGVSVTNSLDFKLCIRNGALKKCTWLKVRNISSRPIGLTVAFMTQLKHLYLEDAFIEDDRFFNLVTMTNLEVLSLSGLKALMPLSLFEKELYVDRPQPISNPHPISGLRHLTTLRSLTYLDISEIRQPTRMADYDTYSSEFDVAECIKCYWPKLKTIKLTGTNIGEANEEKLREIDGLTIEKQEWTA